METSPSCAEVGARIRLLREAAGLKQADLVERLKELQPDLRMSGPTLSRIESGNGPLVLDVLILIARALDKPLAEFTAPTQPADDDLPPTQEG